MAMVTSAQFNEVTMMACVSSSLPCFISTMNVTNANANITTVNRHNNAVNKWRARAPLPENDEDDED